MLTGTVLAAELALFWTKFFGEGIVKFNAEIFLSSAGIDAIETDVVLSASTELFLKY